MRFRNLLLSTVVVWIGQLSQFDLVAQESMITIVPEEYPGALSNPLKGFRGNIGPSTIDHEYATLARHYIRWNEIENNASDSVEKIINFCNQKWAGIENHGIKVIPRVYLDWDQNAGNEYWPEDLQTGDYTSEVFKERLRRLISRLGEAWDKDPRVAWVQMGLIGYWGEHHHPDLTPGMQTLLGDAFRQAFKNKKVLVRHANEFTQYEVGYYWDSWAHNSQYLKEQHGLGIHNINRTTDRWKTHPIEGETAYNWGDYQIQPGDSPNDTLSDPYHREFVIGQIRKLHCSALGWIARYDPDIPEVAAGAAAIQKAFGYRFVITDFACSPRAEPGGHVNLQFNVMNTGSAPFLEDWPIEFSLLDPVSGDLVWRTFLDDVDIRNWLPGTDWEDSSRVYNTAAEPNLVSQSILLPGTSVLPPGEYVVAIAVVDPAGLQPALRFAIKNYYNVGRHPFVKIGIGTDVSGGHAIDPDTFDDLMDQPRLPYSLIQPSSPTAPNYARISVQGYKYRIEFGSSLYTSRVALQRSSNLKDWQTVSEKPSSGAALVTEDSSSENVQAFYRLLAY